MNYEIINYTEVDIELYEKIAEKCIKEVFKDRLKNEEITIFLVNLEKIQEINKTYRDIDKDTDVISFAYNDVEDDINYGDLEVEHYLGDIYICIEKVISQAHEYNHSITREFAFLLIHGCLHLLGYDHEEKKDENIMFKLQNEILEKLNIRREL